MINEDVDDDDDDEIKRIWTLCGRKKSTQMPECPTGCRPMIRYVFGRMARCGTYKGRGYLCKDGREAPRLRVTYLQLYTVARCRLYRFDSTQARRPLTTTHTHTHTRNHTPQVCSSFIIIIIVVVIITRCGTSAVDTVKPI